MMPSFVLDTCAWIWISTGDKIITPGIQKTLQKSDWHIAAISVWEVSKLQQKDRLQLDRPLSTWVHESLKQHNIGLLPLSAETSILSTRFKNSSTKDPADLMILATALHHHATLVTADKKLISYAHEIDVPVLILKS